MLGSLAGGSLAAGQTPDAGASYLNRIAAFPGVRLEFDCRVSLQSPIAGLWAREAWVPAMTASGVKWEHTGTAALRPPSLRLTMKSSCDDSSITGRDVSWHAGVFTETVFRGASSWTVIDGHPMQSSFRALTVQTVFDGPLFQSTTSLRELAEHGRLTSESLVNGLLRFTAKGGGGFLSEGDVLEGELDLARSALPVMLRLTNPATGIEWEMRVFESVDVGGVAIPSHAAVACILKASSPPGSFHEFFVKNVNLDAGLTDADLTAAVPTSSSRVSNYITGVQTAYDRRGNISESIQLARGPIAGALAARFAALLRQRSVVWGALLGVAGIVILASVMGRFRRATRT